MRCGPDNDTLALCALAAQKLFEAQQWAWCKLNSHKQPEPSLDDLDVPDAERILHTLTDLVDLALVDGRASRGRLMVEACTTACSGCDARCVQVWQHLGEVTA